MPDARTPLVRPNLISQKKPVYPVSDFLLDYLRRYGRLETGGVRYGDLLRYAGQIPLYDENGADTLWSTVYYGHADQREVHDALRVTYALLKSDGDRRSAEHLFVDRVDLCLFGNTLPFRIRIVNRLNENFDYFYVKRADANRVYGLELEHLLSPNRIRYFVPEETERGPGGTDLRTLVEEHVIGMPADQFFREQMPQNAFDEVRLAKEFVKFNERCFVRLLGDMHSGNYVVDMTPDFEKMQYRLRPIDFDQQSHHAKRQVYLPQFFPQNNPVIDLGMRHMTQRTVDQYQREERALMAGRLRVSRPRYEALMDVMREDLIAPQANVEALGRLLATHYADDTFARCETMGELVWASLDRLQQRAAPATAALLQGGFAEDVAGGVS